MTQSPPDPKSGLLKIGDVVSAQFTVRGLIAVGGMGEVYDAFDEVLRREVALKASPPNLSVFLHEEARALAAFQHPAIVGIYSCGTHKGVDYFVMERIHGVTLASQLSRRRSRDEQLTAEEAQDIALGIADGLALIHRAGGAHRDLKPSNVMLAPGNRVVLLDFGLFVPETVREAGSRAGTPTYMAPETVLDNVPVGDRFRVDLYALGAILFEMLTGQVPFPTSDEDEAMRRHVEEALPDLAQLRPDVPIALTSLVKRLLSKDPDDRPPTAESVSLSLRRIRENRAAAPDGALSVVIVDDDPHSAKILDFYVREAAPNAIIRTASNGEEGLRVSEQHGPDLILTDLDMPGMNGVEMSMYLRGTHRFDGTRIVALSAKAAANDVRLLRELGVTEFIPKGSGARQQVGTIVKEMMKNRKAKS